ncbi:MAG: Hsp20/alpha crystallin family protein, partial [Balneolaceae bacterium]
YDQRARGGLRRCCLSGKAVTLLKAGFDGYFHRVESRFGTFSRSLPLPNIVDYENIQATYENGVLAITVPKLKEKAGRKIEVS